MARTGTKPAARAAAPTTFSVSAALAGYGDGRLRALLLRRPDLAHPAPKTFAALADRVTAAASAHTAYNTLDVAARQVVGALCLLPRPVTVDRLCDLLGAGVRPGDLTAPLTELGDLALAFAAGEALHLNPGLASMRHPAGLGPPVAVLLGRHNGAQLTAVCRGIGAKAGATKGAALAAIGATLADAGRVRALIDEGPVGTAELAEQVATRGPDAMVPQGLYRLGDGTPVGWMANRALLVPVSWDRLTMPGEVGLALRGGRPFPDFAPAPPPLAAIPADPERIDALGAERALQVVGDVGRVLESWSAQPPKVLKDGGVGIRDVRRVAQAIERHERDAARVIELAGVAGLVAADLVSGVALPTPAYDEWLALEVTDRWAHLVAGWLAADTHPSLAGALDQKDKRVPPLLDMAGEHGAASRRRLVLQAAAEVPGGSATEPASVLGRVLWSHPDLWTRGPGSPAMLVDWVIEEADLLGLGALGSLTTPGRLMAEAKVGQAVATLVARAPAPVSEFVLQADLTAVAVGPLAAGLTGEMELLADVESRGGATVYRFSEASLRRAFDAGRSADGVQAFLERHSAHGVPQALVYLVADVGRRFGTVRVGAPGCYVRSDDTSLLAELLHVRSASRLGLRPLAPTVLVAQAEPREVLSTLRSSGYLPAEEDGGGALVLARPPARRAGPATGGAGSVRHRADELATRARALASGELDAGEILAGFGGPVTAAPSGPDPDTVVAALRRPSPSPAAAPRPGRDGPATGTPPPRPAPAPLPIFADDGDRPTVIAKGPEATLALLEEALANEWVVRLSHTNGNGQGILLNVLPSGIDHGRLVAECLPRWDVKTLNLDRVQWARVLTEAEEDQFL